MRPIKKKNTHFGIDFLQIFSGFWTILAPSWVQLGANFGQFGSISGVPGPAKIDQNRPRPLFVDFSSQAGPQELPDPIWTLIFVQFWGHF